MVSACHNQSWSIYLENGSCWNTVSEQIIKLGSDLQDAGRGAFGENFIGNLRNEGFPIRWRDECLLGDLVTRVSQ